jgi:hypothetical protein
MIITQIMQGQYSRVPMPSLWCSLCHKRFLLRSNIWGGGQPFTSLYKNIVQGDPDFEMFQSLYFSPLRKYTFPPRSKPNDMPIRIYNYMYTPPPSLPSTILTSEQGEKVNIKTNDYSPLRRGWTSQINNI